MMHDSEHRAQHQQIQQMCEQAEQEIFKELCLKVQLCEGWPHSLNDPPSAQICIIHVRMDHFLDSRPPFLGMETNLK